MAVSTLRLIAMVAPKANAREPASAATRTDGTNHSLMNIAPRSDHTPRRGRPR